MNSQIVFILSADVADCPVVIKSMSI